MITYHVVGSAKSLKSRGFHLVDQNRVRTLSVLSVLAQVRWRLGSPGWRRMEAMVGSEQAFQACESLLTRASIVSKPCPISPLKHRKSLKSLDMRFVIISVMRSSGLVVLPWCRLLAARIASASASRSQLKRKSMLYQALRHSPRPIIKSNPKGNPCEKGD